eukprot:XP_014056869.1 PREDICTED: rho GTPase-activating protein 33-like [Salmo salar]
MVAWSTDNLDTSGEPATRSVGTTANLKGKMSKRLSVVKGHFPKLVDCAHFHYDNVEFGSIELQFANEQSDASWNSGSAKDLVFLVQVSCQAKTWMVRRSYEEFRTLDAHLHQCIYDRRYSQLLPLPPLSEIGDRVEIFTPLLSEYLSRLSMIVDNKLNCGPVLTWMEIDNRGNRFLLKEEASLNVPAIAAAHVIKRYTAQASDEISIEVGDILSVIDMPPKEDSNWWRGKHGFQVGFFPSECVELINEKPQSTAKIDGDPASSNASAPGPPSPTSVSKKHGKLMGFLRTFMKSRPTKQKLKQRGILKERVFGCDLGEHLLNSGLDVPQVLKSCSEFIEKHGVVDGIYRHSGVSSNIQKLRHEFDSENVPDLTKDMYMQDIHCVGSLCKLYFRELPNPLLTYQLYDKFADCMGEMTDDERMVKVHDVIQQLPPPHYRTLEYLVRHLAGLATCSGETNMHIKNLAIVWAPNLLRSMEIEAVGLSGADPFKEVRIQSVVVEFLLSHVDVLFSDSFTSVGRFTGTGRHSLTRPKSFVSTRLLSLEEAQARTQAPLLLQGAPVQFQGQFHTVLDHPVDRRKRGMKVRKAAGGSSCQQEIRSKLGPEAKIRGQGVTEPTGPPLLSQPPPPPPKNPARLMALALAESANKALRQGASPPYRPPQSRSQDAADTRYQRSLSADAGELLSSDPNQLYSTVRPLLDLEGNFRPAPHLEANKRPISRGHHQPQPLHHNQGGPRGERGPQLWSKEATRAWAAAHSQSHSFFHGHSHSHHHSQDGSTHHHHPSHHHPRRQTSSSVRLARSEMHPLPSSSIVPLALHQHQRNLHRSNRSASTDLASSQLHPYFENGKVCYRKPEEAPLSLSQPPQGKSLQPSQAHRPTSKDLSEPIYVNFPFPSPSTGAQNTKSWTSTDLDGDSPQDSEPLATPNDPPPPEDQRQSSPRLVPDQGGSTSVRLTPSTPDSPAAHNDSAATTPGSIQGSNFLPAPTASTSTGIHYRSHSDPQSSSCSTEPISGKEIASLLIEKLAEEERAEGPSTVTSSSASTSSSPAMEHPANPYPSQQHNQPPPAYNVYTPGPSRIRAPQRAGAGGFQRQDPLRRSSPGGQYRQAFDVMPSGDQVLKYYRTQDFTPGPQGEHQSSGANPYPPRQHYQEPPYPIQSPQDPCSSGYPSQPLLEPSDSPSAAFSNLTLGAPRPYPGQPGGLQYSQYPFQPGPMLGQYPNTPPRRDVVHEPVLRPQGLRNRRGLARQGSLPAPSPNWTIHTEGQTRSYC